MLKNLPNSQTNSCPFLEWTKKAKRRLWASFRFRKLPKKRWSRIMHFASKMNKKVKNDGIAGVFRLGKRDIFAQKRDYRECFVCFSSKIQFIRSLLEESGAFKQKFVCY